MGSLSRHSIFKHNVDRCSINNLCVLVFVLFFSVIGRTSILYQIIHIPPIDNTKIERYNILKLSNIRDVSHDYYIKETVNLSLLSHD